MADVTTHGDATFDTQGVCQVGFEPGADNFLIVVEQVLMPTKKLTIVQEKQSQLVSAYWKGDYVATSMVLYTNNDTYSSTRAHGVDLNYEIVNGGVTYAAESLVAVEFVFPRLKGKLTWSHTILSALHLLVGIVRGVASRRILSCTHI